MKKHKLIKELENIPDDFEILLSSDEEGNEIHSLRIVEAGLLNKHGEFSGYLDEDCTITLPLNKCNAVVLWP